MTELLHDTSIAATSWATVSGVHLRVYTQDNQGGIRESRFDGAWNGGTANDVIAKAKPHSPIAVFNYNEGKSVRVYYLTAENVIQEICQDNGGKWFAGDLNSHNFKASHESRLTVIGKTWDDHNITLYYQRHDDAIGEIRQDGGSWVQGGTIEDKAMHGTGLAAVTFHTKVADGIRVYYQLPNGDLAEALIDKGQRWKRGGFTKIENASRGSNLAAFAFGVDGPNLQVYYFDKANSPTQYVFNGKWTGPNHPGQTTASHDSGVAVVPVTSPSDLRLYLQDGNNRIQEFVSSGSNWNKGALVPTGH